MTACDPIYVTLSDPENPEITEIESVCMRCYEKGITRLLLTKIPHYKEVIITSFECSSCGDKNNGIQTSSFQPHGISYTLTVEKPQDLSRQIVKSDYATVKIPELDFEKSADGEKGEITTIEGIILKAIDGLSHDQEDRKINNFEIYEKIETVITKLKNLLKPPINFSFVIDDPTGNSFIENLNAPQVDPQLTCSTYQRTQAQNDSLGLHEPNEAEGGRPDASGRLEEISEKEEGKENLKEEVLQFSTICDHCSRPSITKMKVTEIPHFKDVVIMATECDYCGHKTNEVKGGSGIEKKGKKHTLHIMTREDIARDVLKSETCSIFIPEIDLTVGAGIFVGKFTTVEGLLTDIKDDLLKNPFLLGDAVHEDTRSRMNKILDYLQAVIDGSKNIHLILNDPAGNSFIQDLYTPEKDPRLIVEEYERTFEQNEDLGINDMKTENYTEEQ